MLSLPSEITVSRDYGPLKQGTRFHLGDGYSVFVGENNTGKSALLQYLFIASQEGRDNDESVLIQANRSILPDSITPNRVLIQWNAEFVQQYRKAPRHFGGNPSPDPQYLHALLMHGDLYSQLGELRAIVRELGFGEYEVGQAQAQTVSGFPISSMGSGLRALFPIIAAITSPKLKLIFIDDLSLLWRLAFRSVCASYFYRRPPKVSTLLLRPTLI